jgi:hypothetical protein
VGAFKLVLIDNTVPPKLSLAAYLGYPGQSLYSKLSARFSILQSKLVSCLSVVGIILLKPGISLQIISLVLPGVVTRHAEWRQIPLISLYALPPPIASAALLTVHNAISLQQPLVTFFFARAQGPSSFWPLDLAHFAIVSSYLHFPRNAAEPYISWPQLISNSVKSFTLGPYSPMLEIFEIVVLTASGSLRNVPCWLTVSDPGEQHHDA